MDVCCESSSGHGELVSGVRRQRQMGIRYRRKPESARQGQNPDALRDRATGQRQRVPETKQVGTCAFRPHAVAWAIISMPTAALSHTLWFLGPEASPRGGERGNQDYSERAGEAHWMNGLSKTSRKKTE